MPQTVTLLSSVTAARLAPKHNICVSDCRRFSVTKLRWALFLRELFLIPIMFRQWVKFYFHVTEKTEKKRENPKENPDDYNYTK